MDALKKFEDKVTSEYVTHHSLQLMKDTISLAVSTYRQPLRSPTILQMLKTPAKVYEHQIAISAQHRFVSLALREYHCILSQYLSKHGITLPDLESLISETYQD